MHINSIVLKEHQHKFIRDINRNPMIQAVINVGLNIKTSRESIKISRDNYKFNSAIGIHPLYIEGQNIDELCNMYTSKTKKWIRAIGEIGIDTSSDNIDEQKNYLRRQIEVANSLGLPVIIHANTAKKEDDNANSIVIETFETYEKPKFGCVFHCFQPDLEALEYIIENKFYVSFAGRITYPNAKKSLEVAERTPEEYILIETDSPYIAPYPFSRNDMNRTRNITLIRDKLAEILCRTPEDIEDITTRNAYNAFNLSKK